MIRAAAEPTPASYRDPRSRVTIADGVVTRRFDGQGADWFRQVQATGVLDDLVSNGALVPFEMEAEAGGGLLLRSPELPFVSQPFEWSFAMLKDAALATLTVGSALWEAGMHLRDASAFNLTFDGGRPVFLDLGSFGAGHTPVWHAYGQFCDHFLNPLALGEILGIPVHGWWQRSLEGVGVGETAAMLGRWRSIRHGLTRHVWLRHSLERGSGDMSPAERRSLRTDLQSDPAVVVHVMAGLRKRVERMEWKRSSHWVEYESSNTYRGSSEDDKVEFVRAAANQVSGGGGVAIDVGCNTGRYSAVLAERFDVVHAFDSDQDVIDVVHRRIGSGELPQAVRPSVVDVMDPPSGRGFLSREHRPLFDRIGRADLVTWLAVVHHLSIGRNLPFGLFFELAAAVGDDHVVEFVEPADPMADALAASKAEDTWNYSREAFLDAAAARFQVRSEMQVSETRSLFHFAGR